MKIWGKKGKPLIARVQQGFKNFYVYSSVSPNTGESFSLLLPCVNTEIMNIYLEELSKEYKGKKILMIMDQAGWHRSKELKIPENIKIMFLPPYSPELNPVERLWKKTKRDKIHNILYRNLDEMYEVVCEELNIKTKNEYLKLCKCSYL